MATIKGTIEYVDRVKINPYGDEEKYRWISELDGMVRRTVMQDSSVVAYRFPDDGELELVVPYPYDNIYALWLEAKIDFYDKRFEDYNNTAAMFYSVFDEYKKAYIRENMPRSSGGIKNLMG